MPSLETIKQNLLAEKTYLSNHYNINRVGIFGSYAREEQNDNSDIDILIDYSEAPTLLTLIEVEDYLTELLGAPVDLVTQKGLKSQLQPNILKEVIYI